MHITGKSHCSTLNIDRQVGTVHMNRALHPWTRCRSLAPSPPTANNNTALAPAIQRAQTKEVVFAAFLKITNFPPFARYKWL